MRLPYDVLATIANKANDRTKARMRALNRTTASNSRFVVPRSYARGTGLYQRLYNELPKRLTTLTRMFEIHADGQLESAMYDLKWLVHVGMRKYKDAVKYGERLVVGVVEEEGDEKLEEWMRRHLPEATMVAAPGPTPAAPREVFMDRLLTYVDGRVNVLRPLVPIPNAVVSRQMQANRARSKLSQRRRWTRGSGGDTRARRIARRAARQMSSS